MKTLLFAVFLPFHMSRKLQVSAGEVEVLVSAAPCSDVPSRMRITLMEVKPIRGGEVRTMVC